MQTSRRDCCAGHKRRRREAAIAPKRSYGSQFRSLVTVEVTSTTMAGPGEPAGAAPDLFSLCSSIA